MSNQPRFYRPTCGRHISWEIWGFRAFFITLSFGSFEIEFNKWRDHRR